MSGASSAALRADSRRSEKEHAARLRASAGTVAKVRAALVAAGRASPAGDGSDVD